MPLLRLDGLQQGHRSAWLMPATFDELLAALHDFIPDDDRRTAAAQLLQGILSTDSHAIDREDAGADVDLDRQDRCGYPEVIYGEGKPTGLIAEILHRQGQAGQCGFVTRVSDSQAQELCEEFPDAMYNPSARTVAAHGYPVVDAHAGSVAVVSAGSCDAPVAQEALETLRWMGVDCVLIEDVGVAGPHRLLRHVPLLQSMTTIVVVAGMEAALPSVIGGHVRCPIVGVPTSVGYGASLNGVTALLSMLTSCASNVVTVNVDAGFRGGYAAGLIARQRPQPVE